MKEGRRLDVALLVIRIGLGLIILYYGSQKMLGVFGGEGYTGQIAAFQSQGIPPVFGNLAILAEFLGGLGVLLGFLTHLAGFGVACTMAVATAKTASMSGFFHRAFVEGHDANNAFFPAALFFLAIAVTMLGAGRYSLDAKVFGRKGR